MDVNAPPLRTVIGRSIRKVALRAYAAVVFWKWERDFVAADRRMQACSHERTMFVDVGMVLEKCRDCWALKVPIPSPTADGPRRLEWTPNAASPKRSKEVRVG